jgi:hypothetical protein
MPPGYAPFFRHFQIFQNPLSRRLTPVHFGPRSPVGAVGQFAVLRVGRRRTDQATTLGDTSFLSGALGDIDGKKARDFSRLF